MDAEKLKRAWQTAAGVAASIVGAIFFYTVVVEIMTKAGHKPTMQAQAADSARYALYFVGLSAIAVLRMAELKLGGKKATPEETVRALTVLAIVRAALYEVPAVAGLVVFLLTGSRMDFYTLAVFSLMMYLLVVKSTNRIRRHSAYPAA